MTNWESKFKWSLSLSVVLLAGAYLFLVNDSTFAVGARGENEETITRLEAEISSLEAEYLSRLSEIDLVYAGTLGYVDAANQANYVTASRPAGLLAINDES